jgi:hypothetical protein
VCQGVGGERGAGRKGPLQPRQPQDTVAGGKMRHPLTHGSHHPGQLQPEPHLLGAADAQHAGVVLLEHTERVEQIAQVEAGRLDRDLHLARPRLPPHRRHKVQRIERAVFAQLQTHGVVKVCHSGFCGGADKMGLVANPGAPGPLGAPCFRGCPQLAGQQVGLQSDARLQIHQHTMQPRFLQGQGASQPPQAAPYGRHLGFGGNLAGNRLGSSGDHPEPQLQAGRQQHLTQRQQRCACLECLLGNRAFFRCSCRLEDHAHRRVAGSDLADLALERLCIRCAVEPIGGRCPASGLFWNCSHPEPAIWFGDRCS